MTEDLRRMPNLRRMPITLPLAVPWLDFCLTKDLHLHTTEKLYCRECVKKLNGEFDPNNCSLVSLTFIVHM